MRERWLSTTGKEQEGSPAGFFADLIDKCNSQCQGPIASDILITKYNHGT